MAEKLVARSGKVKALPARSKTVEVDGTTITAGDMLALEGEEGSFRFHHANKAGTEVTVWGPLVHGMKDSEGTAAPWNSAQWRTVVVGKVLTVAKAEEAKAKAAEVHAANGGTDYSQMTPGQKAAWTKRMKAQALVAA